MYIGLRVNYPLFLSDINGTRIFSTDFTKNPQISNFMKIRPMGAGVVPCGRTDGYDEANSRFSQFFFVKVPKNAAVQSTFLTPSCSTLRLLRVI